MELDEIYERLETRREELHLPEQEICRRAGLSAGALREIGRGKEPGILRLQAIAQVLGLSVGQVIGEVPPDGYVVTPSLLATALDWTPQFERLTGDSLGTGRERAIWMLMLISYLRTAPTDRPPKADQFVELYRIFRAPRAG